MKRKPEPIRERLTPISMHPLTPEEALGAFMKVQVGSSMLTAHAPIPEQEGPTDKKGQAIKNEDE